MVFIVSTHSFKQFIEQKGFCKKYFQNPQVKKISVCQKSPKWVLQITFKHLPLVCDLAFFLEQLLQELTILWKNQAQTKPNLPQIEYNIDFENWDYLESLAESYFNYIITQASLIKKYHDLDYFAIQNHQVNFQNGKFIIFVNPNAFKCLNKKMGLLQDFFSKFYGFKNEFILSTDRKIYINRKKSTNIEIEELQQNPNHQTNSNEQNQEKNPNNKSNPTSQTDQTKQAKTTPQTKAYNHNKGAYNSNSKMTTKDTKIKDLPKNKQELEEFNRQNPNTYVIVEGFLAHPIKEANFQYSYLKFVIEENDNDFSIENKDAILIQKKVSKDEKEQFLKANYQTGQLFRITARINYSAWDDVHLMMTQYETLESDSISTSLIRQDFGFQGKKRIEFHTHTKMSNLDAINSAKEYLQIAESWGHEAIAFTDHDGIYAYPEINEHAKNKKIKPIYGVEVDFIEEKPIYITNQKEDNLEKDFVLKEATYVVFDLETTGLSNVRDKIIEIAGVKIKNGNKIGEFQKFIDPQQKLTKTVTDITNITDEMLQGQQTIDQVLPQFLAFAKDCVLVAHNASFDINFLKEKAKELKISLEPQPIIDTMALSQRYFSNLLKYFSLKRLATFFKVKLEDHHRALADATATAEVFIKMIDQLADPTKDPKDEQVITFFDLQEKINPKYERPYHINILVANQTGYRNLFELLSNALTKDFNKSPRVLKSNLANLRQGLLVGSGCMNSNIFEIALNQNISKLKKAISFYDYIEVQPPQAYKHLIHDLGKNGLQIIETTLKTIIKESQKQAKIVIATGDVHYIHPWEKDYREIYISAKMVGGGLHKLSRYENKKLPENHLLTTQEMIDAFAFLQDEKLIYEIVIENTHLLNSKIEKIKAFSSELFSFKDDAFKANLQIPSIKEEIKRLVDTKVKQMYGTTPHPLIKERLDQELKSIIGETKNEKSNQNIAPVYYLSHLLVKNSLEKGYLVGSRGSIGSSLVATMLEITEVNPLKPHYYCPQCNYTIVQLKPQEKEQYYNSEEEKYHNELDKVFSGYDLPNMPCLKCDTQFKKDGHDIPFETFLGFEGNKTPDIDLNFAGDYQSQAHNYIKELLGEKHAFRAGTIQTVAQRNAYGYTMGFVEEKQKQWRKQKVAQIANKIEGVKRSNGQHPGGIVVVPPDRSIYEVTPVQYPANDTNWKTTHFDYHSFEQNLFKLDILGHDDPMMIKFLMDYVKENRRIFPFTRAQDIPVDDPEVYKLFSNEFKIDSSVNPGNKITINSLGIPEFGTIFVKQMLKDLITAKQNSQKQAIKINFAALVKISGLSHGTDVWNQNARDAINKTGEFEKYKNKTISFDDIIGCRDDIMLQLQEKGLNPLKAFDIMEFIRKGKPQDDFQTWNKYKQEMKDKVEAWYIDSAAKIKYLFPKAHATAYVIMALRIAWFKMHAPLAFYSGYFSKRTEQFDHQTMISNDIKIIKEKLNKLAELKKSKKIKTKEDALINTLKIAEEMVHRGFKFLTVDFNKSDVSVLKIEDGGFLRMPLLSINGLGLIAANKIVEARQEKPFTKADFATRSKINKTILAKAKQENLLDSLEDE
ncbi:PolC-type DNA polymerase III [Maize bushy stunt phytoplasma]|uniref:PolC-type DNA polymerase III n=1 Tax=Maize bushy stunt phytoplasma TaxID=202462 RepID=UPI0018DD348B